MTQAQDRFLELARERVVVFDGAMGTSVHAADLSLDDFSGLENCTEILTRTRPDVIEQIHRSFLEAGCDVIETNTFGANRVVLAEFDLADETCALNVEAARLARRVADEFSTPQRPRFVAGSVGPGTKLLSLRQIDYDTLLASYREQIRGLLDGGVDLLAIETCQDIGQAKVAIAAAREAFEAAGRRVPLMVSITMETTGTMLVGTDIAAALVALEAFDDVDVIGLNCATGPQEMAEHVRYLSRHCGRLISVMPNAGLPQVVEGRTHFPLSPAELARWLREFVTSDGVRIVGGCCGTTPEHIAAVVEAVRDATPAERQVTHEPACSSLYQAVPYRQQTSFLIVGERCNTNGSRKFKRLLAEGDIDGCVQMGIEQVNDGAHVLDVCVDYVGRDGVADMQRVVSRFAQEVTAPLMLDSTQPDVIEAGLKLAPGKCIVNSVNLEEGEAKVARICALLKRYGAAVVALTIDDDPAEAMAKTAERKVQIARRLHSLLVERHGIRPEDIFFDLLTFPITTGNPEDRRLALETLEGIERVRAELPECQFILGVSNVSFGLAPAARAVLNSAFLHEALKRGLTAAIVHASKILPRNRISDERWEAALDLIYDRHDRGNPLERFIGLFEDGERIASEEKIESLPLEERLKRRIIDGNRTGLEADLDEALKSYGPIQIINDFLLEGMKVVGELFGSGQMQLPFVLRSAETMKAAVAYLQPHMDRLEGVSRGKVVLATVRGDVHDIGKNLVDIILTNNGYTVYNLGIKQPIANIIEAFRKHEADVIGLSGLLVKSTLVMRDDLITLNEQGLSPPVILGGAALTRRYVEQDLRPIYHGPLFYAKDAFEGLHLVQQIVQEGTEARRHEGTKEPATRDEGRGTRDEGAGRRAQGAKDKGRETRDDEPRTSVRADARTATDTGRAEEPRTSVRAAPAARRAPEQLDTEVRQRLGLAPIEDETAVAVAERDTAQQRTPAGASARTSVRGSSARPRTAAAQRAERIAHDNPVPRPPFWGSRVLEHIPLRAALAYINETMLFQVQWGFRKKGRSPDEWKRYVDTQIRPIYRALVERCEREQIIRLAAVYGYWPCQSSGDELIIYEPPAEAGAPPEAHGPERLRFRFPRQSREPHWCLADFWRSVESGQCDVVAFQAVTAGPRVSEVARQWFEADDYRQYLFLHGLGVEVAEALAEYLHRQIRMELGIADRDAREIQALFKQGYQGCRYSFGYPACPNLEDQARLVELLATERIGLRLTEEYQLEPEQSTTAIVAHHPQARYFSVR